MGPDLEGTPDGDTIEQLHFNTNFITYAQNPKESNTTYRNWIAYTGKEICTIVRIDVFCVDKTCFLRPGHICRAQEVAKK